MEEDEGGVAVVRHLIGQIQELCDLYGSPSPPPFLLHHYQRYFSDLNNSSLDDSICHFISGEKMNNMLEDVHKSPPAKKFRRDENCERVSDSAESLVIMDDKIWKEFPEDLFEAVIARLPIAAFFRFRSVCQKWNSLLTSNSLSKHFSEVPQKHPWFYMIRRDENKGVMYDPCAKVWHHIRIPSLPAWKLYLPVSSAAGLICFMDIGYKKFVVCNPLTQSYEKIPLRKNNLTRVAVGMILNGNSTADGYKIMWLANSGEHEVYDAVEDCWTRPSMMPSSIKLPIHLNFRSQALSMGRTVYFMHFDPEGIISYDIASGVWKQLLVPLPTNLKDQVLAGCNGHIMLVGLLSKNAATCVCVWELQKMTLLWKEVDRMPNLWCLDFYGKHVQMTCLGNHGLLMLSLRSEAMNRLVTYDPSNREWNKVPGCVLPKRGRKLKIISGTAFYPCPTAIA